MLKAHEEKMSREELLRNYSRVKKRCVELVLERDDAYELLGELLDVEHIVVDGFAICPLCLETWCVMGSKSEEPKHKDTCPRKRAEEVLKN